MLEPSCRAYAIIILTLSVLIGASALADSAEEPAAGASINGKPSMLVALTFDDGPSVYTDAILDILEENGVRATFCVLGRRVVMYPDKVRRAAAMGCEVIGHSWDHTMLVNLTNEEMTRQIMDTHRAIALATGVEPPMIYRAPGGTISPRLLALSGELGFTLLHWTVGSNDFALRDAKKIYKAVYYNTREGAIILCHDIYGETVKAMRKVIPRLIEQGYRFVTVTELMRAYGDELSPGTVYRGHKDW